MDCYILHTLLLVIRLIFIIAINCRHYTKQSSKQTQVKTKTYWCTNNIKMENNEFKEGWY